jgi:hypothetical protein
MDYWSYLLYYMMCILDVYCKLNTCYLQYVESGQFYHQLLIGFPEPLNTG